MSACFSTIQSFSYSSIASFISFSGGSSGGPVQIIVLNGTLLVPGMPGYNTGYNAFVFGNTTINGSSTGTFINNSVIPITTSVLCVGGGGAGGQGGATFNGGGGGGAQVVGNAAYVIPAAGNTVVSVASGSYINGSSTIDLTTTLATTINNGTTSVTAYSGRAGGFNNGAYYGTNLPILSGQGGGGAGSSSIGYAGSLLYNIYYSTTIANSISTTVTGGFTNYSGSIVIFFGIYTFYILISTNYGQTWTNQVFSNINGGYGYQNKICMSDNGQYLYYQGDVNANPPILYTSTNLGVSVLYSCSLPSVSGGAVGAAQPLYACSTSGQYLIAIYRSDAGTPLYINYSTNYGVSFIAATSLGNIPYYPSWQTGSGYNYVNFVYGSTATFLVPRYNSSITQTTSLALIDFTTLATTTIGLSPVGGQSPIYYIANVRISQNKQYITYLYSINYSGNTFVLASSTNSGVSWFLPTNATQAPNGGTAISFTAVNIRYQALTMDATGQYQSFGASETTITDYRIENDIFISTNYGVSFYSVDTSDKGSISAAFIAGICGSGNGQHLYSFFVGTGTNPGYIYNLPGFVFPTIGNAGGNGLVGTRFTSSYSFSNTTMANSLGAISSKNMSIIVYYYTTSIYYSTDYGTSWQYRSLANSAGNTAGSVLISDDGRYLYYAQNGSNAATPVITTSTNFGATSAYTATCPTSTSSNSFYNMSCSTSGQYILIIYRYTSPYNYPVLSSNYGVSFASVTAFGLIGIGNPIYPQQNVIPFVYSTTATFLIQRYNGSSTTSIAITNFLTNTATYVNTSSIPNWAGVYNGLMISQDTKYITLAGGSGSIYIKSSSNYGASFTTAINASISPNYGTNLSFSGASTAYTQTNPNAMSVTGQYQAFVVHYLPAPSPVTIFISTNYGYSFSSVDPANLYPLTCGYCLSLLMSGDGSITHCGWNPYSTNVGPVYVIKGANFNNSLYGNGGGGGGMGSNGNSTGGSGTVFAISTQAYGGGGYGAASVPLPITNAGGGGYGSNYTVSAYAGAPGSGGGGGGGTSGYTAGAWGGSGQVAVYFSTAYTLTYSSSNPPNQTYISNIAQGGPAVTGTSVLAFLAGLPSFTSANPYTYNASGYTGASLYQNGNYIVSASSYNIAGSNYASYLLSASISTVFSPNSAYTSYTGSTTTYDKVSGTWITGEWFQVQIPYSIILTTYSFYTNANASPSAVSLMGSNDGALFYTLNTQIGLSAATAISVSSINTGTVSGAYFSIYRWIVTTGRSTGIATSIYNIQLTN